MTKEQQLATAAVAGIALWLFLRKKSTSGLVGDGDVSGSRIGSANGDDAYTLGNAAGQDAAFAARTNCDCPNTPGDATSGTYPCGCDESEAGAQVRDSGQPIGALGAEAAGMIAGDERW